MLNRICGPELTFNMGDDSPHALVAYLDGEKDSVPVSFIQKFPKNWREKGWDINYLYKVFWSGVEDDNPPKMLKKVAEIPVFEQGSSMEKPGYYRAAVVAVKDTLNDLERHLEDKRPSVGVLKYKYTSFDKGSKDCKPRGRSQPKVSNVSVIPPKPAVLKNKKSLKGSKKSGINLTAQSRNNQDLRTDLEKRYPNLIKKDMKESDLDSENVNIEETIKDDDCEDTVSLKSHESFLNPSLILNCGFEEGTEFLNFSNDCDAKHYTPSKTKRDIPSLKRSKSSKSTTINTSEDEESSSGAEVKKLKLDPDFTPRKYEAAKVEVALQKNSIKRLGELNLKLQEKNLKLESTIQELEARIKELENQLLDMKIKKANTTKVTEPKIKIKVSSEKKKEKSVSCVKDSDGKESVKRQISFCTTDDPKSMVAKDEDFSDVLSSVEGSKPNLDVSSGYEQNLPEESDLDEPLVLCPNVIIPNNLRKMIFSIPDIEKKDIKFIKHLALVAFGPVVLATSSIKGTQKGRKGADNAKKTALDKTILTAVRDKLSERVARAEKISVEEAKVHERCQNVRYHNALRDLQKRCRQLGFVECNRSNKVDLSVLNSTLK